MIEGGKISFTPIWLLTVGATIFAVVSLYHVFLFVILSFMLLGVVFLNPLMIFGVFIWLIPISAILIGCNLLIGYWRELFGKQMTRKFWILSVAYNFFGLLFGIITFFMLRTDLEYISDKRLETQTFYIYLSCGFCVGTIFAALTSVYYLRKTYRQPVLSICDETDTKL